MDFTQKKACEFIAEHISALAKLAVGADLTTLAYLLSMAQIEADNQVIDLRKPKKTA